MSRVKERTGGRRDLGRYVQLGLVFLLGFCVAQTAWWVIDQWQYTARVRARVALHLEAERRAAERMLDAGVPPAEIEELLPGLLVEPGAAAAPESGDDRAVAVSPESDDDRTTDAAQSTRPTVRVDPGVWEAIADERFHRLNQYGWEGGFFVVVLVATMAMLARALRSDARVRRRQQGFLATVSHELRSRLASIRLAAETLAMRAGEDPDARQRQVGRVVGNVDRLDRMVTNLLDTARLEEGQFRIRPADIELLPIVRQVVSDASDRAERNRARLEVEVDEELEVRADPTAVETVLRNLVHNAIEAVRETDGGVVRVDATAREGFVRVRVADNGRGFDPALERTLFEMFYRPGDETGRGGRGSGLGLYIVEQLMRLGGGRVKAHSDGAGSGAVFTTAWPAGERGR